MKILVIEDEHKIARFMKTGLELESWTVDLTFNGEEGLDLATSENFDVIILDLMIPKVPGVEFLKLLRNKWSIHTPVLVLTAKGAIDDKVECLDNGADDYLVKPFAFAELVSRVRALARRPKTQIQQTLSIANLKLDTLTRNVERGGAKIALSKKEYALLEYLLRFKRQVRSKDEIIQNIWSYDDDILPNTVEVYINYLREKIDKPFGSYKPIIHTVRGFGYKIDDE